MKEGFACPTEEHKRIVILKARCMDCKELLDNPFGKEVFKIKREEKDEVKK